MRVLFLSTPLVSHIYPMVPMAWALRAAGHDVVFATTGPGLAVSAGGVDVIDIDPAGECPSVADLNSRRPDLVTARARKVADGLPLLIEATRQYLDKMIAVAQSWRPDLIVHSQLQGSGPIAAAMLGVPAVEHGSSLLRGGDFYEQLPELIPGSSLAKRRGALDVAPPSMVSGPSVAPTSTAQHEPVAVWPMRYVPFNGSGVLPPELAVKPARPRIAITFGTTIMAPNLAQLLPRLVRVTGTVAAEFVLLLSGFSTEIDLGSRIPPNLRLTRDWVPLRRLLGGCSAIVHHGGAGSTLAALDAGLPQLIVPSGAPAYLQSDAVRKRGTGIVAEPDEVDAELLTRLIEDGGLRDAAAEVSAEIAAMPSPAEISTRLDALAGERS